MKAILFFLLLFSVSTVFSQKPVYSTKNKKAIKLYEKARAAGRTMDLKTGAPNFDISIGFLNQAIAKDVNFWEAHLMAAEYQEYKGNWAISLVHYDEAIRVNPRHSPSGSTYFYAGNAAYMAGQFDKSIRFLDTYATYKNASQELLSKAEDIRQSCIFSQESLKNPYPYNPINLGPGVNTDRPEYFPTITVDGETILFTRLVKDARLDPRIGVQEDFFVSNLSDKGVWMKADPMPSNINSAYNEGAPTIAADGRTLIFVACSNFSGDTDYGDDRTGRGSCDLFVTKKLGAKWTNPENLPGYINSGNWETQPSLSADGKTLYFIRGLKKAQNGSRSGDIYTSVLGNDGVWGEPKPLSNVINTPLDEESVLIHPDGKTLYFASEGHVGLGGSDLFMSTLNDDGTWTKPVNLGYPINTKGEENSLMVTLFYFTSTFAPSKNIVF
jgi:tetratricopeptide (TPR) repeat protein